MSDSPQWNPEDRIRIPREYVIGILALIVLVGLVLAALSDWAKSVMNPPAPPTKKVDDKK